MSLQVWLPLNGDLHNQGLSNITVTNNGATVNTSGKIGSCYSFDKSVPTYLKLTNPIVSNNSGISFAFWIKLPANASGNNQVVHIGNGAGWNNNRCTCFIRSGTAQLVFTCGDGTDSTAIHSTQYNCISSAITLNQWTHVVCSYIAGLMKIYINGIENKNYTTTIAPNVTNIEFIGIGAAPNAGEPCTCYLNDVRIYDHALSAKEVEEIAKGLVLHYKLDNNGLGNPNLLINSLDASSGSGASGITKSIGSNGEQIVVAESGNGNWVTFGNHNTTLDLAKGDIFTFSLKIKSPNSTKKPNVYFQSGMGYFSMQGTISNEYSIIYYTGTWDIDNLTTNIHLGFGSAPGTYYIEYFKLEKGNTYTPWAPSVKDVKYGNIISNIVYDASGYSNNGTIIGSLEMVNDSPRYSCATKFDGSSSAIKVTNNSVMAQGAAAMTINLWAKASTWPTTGRLFSCTESGGFNLEGGNSGYWRFPIRVYTNAEQTSTAYKYDSKEIQISALPTNEWVMLTCVYDVTGTKTYINGELHHIYSNVSYGIYFNTNARLFLGCEANTANPSAPYYNGQMSDFRLYYTVLTSEQIKELYNTSMSIDNNGNIHARELVEV